MLPSPAFLMIGSMKSGTTSVFEDMVRHPSIFSPTIKEPGDLADDDVLTEAGRKEYFKIFRDAAPHQYIGEASTLYTYYPHVQGVPERAKQLYGTDLKLIFLGREPIQRIKSHYRHEVQKGRLTGPLKDELANHPIFEDVSDYDMQLQQWLNVFPKNAFLVLHMQDYLDNPTAFIHRIWKHLGLEVIEMEHGLQSNVSSGKRAPRGVIRSIVRSRSYGLYAKKFIPKDIRQGLRRLLVPKRSAKFDDHLPENIQRNLSERLQSKTVLFREMVDQGRSEF
jgi:hypothetical protein